MSKRNLAVLDQQDRISSAVSEISPLANMIPGVIILHQLPDMKMLYMSEQGTRLLGVSLEEVMAMPHSEFQNKFLNEEEAKEYTPKIIELLEGNKEFVSYFQQVRTSKTRHWDWYLSLSKVLLRDQNEKPLIMITIANQIDPQHYFTSKATRLLEENQFLKLHYSEFAQLTKREREILGLMALGKSTVDIARQLHISEATAETHRKNIRRKVNINSPYDLYMYAQAFNLV
jgi:DNA-binding CsgD family transcriptional regulator